MKNPFLAWYETQPLTTTQASLAKELGVSRMWVNNLMSERPKSMPSLRLAMAIERRTGGAVKAADLHVFIDRMAA